MGFWSSVGNAASSFSDNVNQQADNKIKRASTQELKSMLSSTESSTLKTKIQDELQRRGDSY